MKSCKRMRTQKTWRELDRGNLVLDGEGFFISYNPDTGSGPAAEALDEIARMFGPAAGFHDDRRDGEETALVIKDPKVVGGHTFLILKGDFRPEFEDAFEVGGLEACRAVYEKYKATHRSDWSSDWHE